MNKRGSSSTTTGLVGRGPGRGPGSSSMNPRLSIHHLLRFRLGSRNRRYRFRLGSRNRRYRVARLEILHRLFHMRRLKRIKDRFREMAMWFERVMLEDAIDDGDVTQVEEDEKVAAADQEEEEVQVINVKATDDENNAQGLEIAPVTEEDCDQKRFEETVSLEKIGECLVIQISCRCGIPYQFLLGGGNCYYKLM